MNAKMKELLQSMQEKIEAAKAADAEKAADLMAEYDGLKKEYETASRVYEAEKEAAAMSMAKKPLPEVEDKEVEKAQEESYKDKFMKAIKTGDFSGLKKDISEGVKGDGGYTVPEDIVNKVEERRKAAASLLDLVSVESVTTNKGQRTFQKRSQVAGFTKVGEKGKIAAQATPQFEIVEYTINKYAGAFVATNESLEDSVENLEALLVNWMADNSRVTANKLILEKLKTFAAVTLTEDGMIDEIKKALNVTLGQAFKPYSTIVTNDDGLQILDTMKDNDGNYLLSESPADPMKLVLCAGTTTVPVVVIPNADLASEEGKVPFIIGDLKTAVRYFDRKKRTMLPSNTATIGELNAYEQDLTLFRCIEREDVEVMDPEAAVFATLTVGA